jgi:hypothetical protein
MFSLYLVLLLLLMTVNFYALLSGMNMKTVNIWNEIALGFFCLVDAASLFFFCNYAHYFANNVRKFYLKKYIAIFVYVIF